MLHLIPRGRFAQVWLLLKAACATLLGQQVMSRAMCDVIGKDDGGCVLFVYLPGGHAISLHLEAIKAKRLGELLLEELHQPEAAPVVPTELFPTQQPLSIGENYSLHFDPTTGKLQAPE